jgi:restriction endonuclease S subunit
MEATMQNIDLKNINKSGWETFHFEEITSKISETVDPNSTDLETYVGLEHLDADDIHIRRKGTPDDVSGGKLKCYPGDVIFGKRRAYQRKAAIVDFEGICSAHAFVFRANSDIIDPKLFPFFLHSDQFMHRMVDISVGGLSPTINWGDLKHQEFLLPPKDQQAQLAELLWAMDQVIEREKEVLEKLNNSYSTLVDNLFSKRNYNWDLVSINKVAKVNSKSLDSKTDPNYEFYYLDLSAIVEPKVIGELKKMKFKDAPSRAKRIVQDDSIILAMVRPYQKAFAYLETATNIISSTGTAVINMNDVAISRFVFHQFFSKRFTKFCEDRMTGTSYPAITPKDVEEYKISIPKNQDLIFEESEKLDKLDFASSTVKSKISSSQSLQKSLINQIF